MIKIGNLVSDHQDSLEKSITKTQRSKSMFRVMFTLAGLSTAAAIAMYSTNPDELALTIPGGAVAAASGIAALCFSYRATRAKKETNNIIYNRHNIEANTANER